MTDKVRPLKLENPADGGTELDMYPTEVNPQEDNIVSKGIYLIDDTVYLGRVGSELTLEDAEVNTITLKELVDLGSINTVTITGTHVADGTKDVIYCNPSTDFSVTLPSPADGSIIYLKSIRTITPKRTITISPSTGMIDGQSSIAIKNTEALTVIGDGSDWWIN